MNNIFGAIVGFVTTLLATIFPSPKDIALVQPTETVAIQTTSTPIPLPTETIVPTIPLVPSITKTILPTKAITPTRLPTPTLDLKKNEECNQVNMPIYLFSGHECFPKANITPDVHEKCNSSYHCTKEFDVESPMVRLDLDGVRNRMLAQCQKVDKGEFIKCNASIEAAGRRLLEEVGKGLQGEVNSCISNAGAGADSQQSKIEEYLKRNKLKTKLEEIYQYCFSHGFSVETLHY